MRAWNALPLTPASSCAPLCLHLSLSVVLSVAHYDDSRRLARCCWCSWRRHRRAALMACACAMTFLRASRYNLPLCTCACADICMCVCLCGPMLMCVCAHRQVTCTSQPAAASFEQGNYVAAGPLPFGQPVRSRPSIHTPSTHIHARRHTRSRVQADNQETHSHTHRHTRTPHCACVCTCMCRCLYACMCVHVCVCVCVYDVLTDTHMHTYRCCTSW
jgi:hypothetical protein